MRHGSLEKDTKFAGVGADVQQAYTELSFIRRERGLGGGNGLQHRLGNFKSGAIGAGDRACNALPEQVAMCRSTLRRAPTMPTGSKMPGCSIEDELAGQPGAEFRGPEDARWPAPAPPRSARLRG